MLPISKQDVHRFLDILERAVVVAEGDMLPAVQVNQLQRLAYNNGYSDGKNDSPYDEVRRTVNLSE
jgi:hypothetical protein